MAKTLRVVAPDEKPEQKPPMTVTVAASDGDRLDLLIAMRERVALAVENKETPARDLAALTRRLMEIAKDIDVLKAAKEREGGASGPVEDEAFDASAV